MGSWLESPVDRRIVERQLLTGGSVHGYFDGPTLAFCRELNSIQAGEILVVLCIGSPEY